MIFSFDGSFLEKQSLTQKFKIHIQKCFSTGSVDLLSEAQAFRPKVNASFPNPRPAGGEQDLPAPRPNQTLLRLRLNIGTG